MNSLQKSPSWRWDAAQAAAESRCFQPYHEHAAAAQRFLHKLANCQTAFDWDVLSRQMPNFFGAYSIFAKNGPVGHALEARILAAEALESIAAKTGLSAKVIQTYEDFFFDVRGRLSQIDFILNQAIGLAFRDPQGDTPYFIFWKVLGYLGGGAVLDALMQTAPTARRPANPHEVDAFFARETQMSLTRKMAQAVQSLDPGSREQFGSITTALHQLLGDQQKKEGDPLDAFSQHIKAYLEEIPWMVGEQAEKGLEPALLSLDNYAAELRDDELQQFSRGEAVPGLENLGKLQLPLPKPKKDQKIILD